MSRPKKFQEIKLRLQFNSFTHKLDFDVLWFRRRRVYKIQEEKKLKAAKRGLVRIKEYLNTHNRVKYFLPYLAVFE